LFAASDALLYPLKKQEMQMANVGEKAPDFTVGDHTGNQVAFNDLSGQHVVLWFYPKADTPG